MRLALHPSSFSPLFARTRLTTASVPCVYCGRGMLDELKELAAALPRAALALTPLLATLIVVNWTYAALF